jgi:O-antigen/teichoic acid export membrane protein
MNLLIKLLGGLLLVGLFLGLVAGISALTAYIAMLLWNFIVVSMHHSELQVGFWVTWAVMFLISLIAAPFRTRVTTKD